MPDFDREYRRQPPGLRELLTEALRVNVAEFTDEHSLLADVRVDSLLSSDIDDTPEAVMHEHGVAIGRVALAGGLAGCEQHRCTGAVLFEHEHGEHLSEIGIYHGRQQQHFGPSDLPAVWISQSELATPAGLGRVVASHRADHQRWSRGPRP